MDISKYNAQANERQSLSSADKQLRDKQLGKTQQSQTSQTQLQNPINQRAYQVANIQVLTNAQLKNTQNVAQLTVEGKYSPTVKPTYLLTLNQITHNKADSSNHQSLPIRLISQYKFNPGEQIFLSKQPLEGNNSTFNINKEQFFTHIISSQLRNTLPYSSSNKLPDTYWLLQKIIQTPQLRELFSQNTASLLQSFASTPNTFNAEYLSELIQANRPSSAGPSSHRTHLATLLSSLLIDLNGSSSNKNSAKLLASQLLSNFQNSIPTDTLINLLKQNQTNIKFQTQNLTKTLSNLILQSLFNAHTKQWQTIDNNVRNDTQLVNIDIPFILQNRATSINAEFITLKPPITEEDNTSPKEKEEPSNWQVNVLVDFSQNKSIYVSIKYLQNKDQTLTCHIMIFSNGQQILKHAKSFEPKIISAHKNSNIKAKISYFDALPKTASKNTVKINMVDLHI